MSEATKRGLQKKWQKETWKTESVELADQFSQISNFQRHASIFTLCVGWIWCSCFHFVMVHVSLDNYMDSCVAKWYFRGVLSKCPALQTWGGISNCPRCKKFTNIELFRHRSARCIVVWNSILRSNFCLWRFPVFVQIVWHTFSMRDDVFTQKGSQIKSEPKMIPYVRDHYDDDCQHPYWAILSSQEVMHASRFIHQYAEFQTLKWEILASA